MQDGPHDIDATTLGGAIRVWRGIVDEPVGSAGDLAGRMRALYSAVFSVDFAALDPQDVAANAPHLTQDLFDLYLRLRDRLPEWRALGLLDEPAVTAVRNAMRIVRYTIDIVNEVASGFAALPAGATTHPAFAGPAQHTILHPALADGTNVDFRPGDVLLVRGRLTNSAAIARIGDVDSQFSHVGIVHIDAAGERWLVEALIEDGTVMSPLTSALDHGLGRAVLFRHRDAQLAAAAAAAAARRVASAPKSWRGTIPYDFSMQLDGHDRFFCSKLVRYAYGQATPAMLALPSFGTRLAMKDRDFFERLGVTAVETFAPADFEVEPAFDIVAEWRDHRVTSNLRLQDLVMTKLFEWMEEHGYRFRETLGIAALASIGRLTSFGPGVVKQALTYLGFPRIPANMQLRTITTIGMLHGTAQPLVERLTRIEAAHIAATRRPLHPARVFEELERVRLNAGGRIGYLIAPT